MQFLSRLASQCLLLLGLATPAWGQQTLSFAVVPQQSATQLAEAIARTNPGSQASQQMIADELDKLFSLLQKGAITQEEYLAQKGKLMGS